MESHYQDNKITIENLNIYKKNHFMHFPGDVQKNPCFENFGFLNFLFKQFELSNLSPITTLKTDSITNVPCECS